MKFALVNRDKTEAQPGLKGICIHCQGNTIAKCGQVKIWHWAHKSKVSCDSWWEKETEWHRAWKNQFPIEWQEIIHIDATTREKHIADIKTGKGLVIEFQHSAIKPDEIKSREAFYKNMVWVIDGTRLKRDYPRFREEFNNLRNLKNGFFLSHSPEDCFHPDWLKSSVPVYFDFKGDPSDRIRDSLWCLFPGRIEGYVVIAGIPREDFIKFSSTDPNLLLAKYFLSVIGQFIREEREAQKRRVNQRTNAFLQFPIKQSRRRHRRL